MRSICLITIIFTVVNGSFINPYPRHKLYKDGGDPGEPLYLTSYIESGDIEKVSNSFYVV